MRKYVKKTNIKNGYFLMLLNSHHATTKEHAKTISMDSLTYHVLFIGGYFIK